MHPVHLVLAAMFLGGLLAAWFAERAGYGPGNFAALVVLSVAAFALLAWIVVVVFDIEAPARGEGAGYVHRGESAVPGIPPLRNTT